MPHLVILTADTDCDVTSYGAHKVSVPDDLAHDDGLVLAYSKRTGQMPSYYDCIMGVLDLLTFRGIYFPPMSPRDRAYFNKIGYTSRHISPDWNPWVYDDTIGIPALDTRYDD